MNKTEKNNEKWEPLGKNINICTSSLHKFSTDTLLLAHFAQAYKAKKAADLGAGCGGITFVWAKQPQPSEITAVEIQADAVSLMRKTIEANGLQERVAVLNVDMRDEQALKNGAPFGSFDLVACNPPYKEVGTGILNNAGQKTQARHEVDCSLNDVAFAAAKLLAFGGRFCVCLRPERLTDLLLVMRKNSLEPKRLRFVQQRQSKAPKLVLAEGRKGGKSGFLDVLPTLFIEGDNGNFSPEMLEIYGDYKTQVQE
ncbi:MAG: methyltransferase [Oscillospiraceae bacterium]|jgi:tRNA1(Val) A37 N6-methylase TrmN6|nr:methyltransferase [Oscillospiraceae bacterium]